MTMLIALVIQPGNHYSHGRDSLARIPRRLPLGQSHANKEVQYLWF